MKKEFSVTQGKYTFHMSVHYEDLLSPLDLMSQFVDNHHGINDNDTINLLKEVETGDYVITSDYEILYRLGDYRDDWCYCYGNLTDIVKDLLPHADNDPIKAMNMAHNHISADIERLQGFIDGDWCYLNFSIDKVVITETREIHGNFFAISVTHEDNDCAYRMLEWDNLDDSENYDQLTDFFMDTGYEFDPDFELLTETLREMCYLTDNTDWSYDNV